MNLYKLARFGLALAVVTLGVGRAQAQQFTLVDITYEHKYEYGSHYRVKPSAQTPSNWKSPIDFTKGRVYGHIEVMTRPSEEPAAFLVCMEATPSYACLVSPGYKAPKVLDFSTAFDKMFQANRVDWTKKPFNVALIQKNGRYQNIEVADFGEAVVRKYLPSKLRVVVTFVAEGATYMPPPGVSPDAGIPAPKPMRLDAAVGTDAGRVSADAMGDADAGTSSPTMTEAPNVPPSATTPSPSPPLAMPMSPSETTPRGQASNAGGPLLDSKVPESPPETETTKSSGCSMSGARGHSPLALVLLSFALFTQASRRRRANTNIKKM